MRPIANPQTPAETPRPRRGPVRARPVDRGAHTVEEDEMIAAIIALLAKRAAGAFREFGDEG